MHLGYAFFLGNRSVPIEQRSISMPVNVAKDPRIYNITVASAISRVRWLVGSFSLPDPYLSAGQCHIILRRRISLAYNTFGRSSRLAYVSCTYISCFVDA